MTYLTRGIHAAAVLLFAANVGVRADTATTGDLGANIISGAGTYTWSPTISAPYGTANGTITVEHNLWTDPVLNVHVYVNGTDAGSFVVQMPPFFGPTVSTLTIGNLLVDGVNTITFDGGGGSEAQYSISRATLNFDVVAAPPPPPPPPPATNSVPVSTNDTPFLSRAAVLHYMTFTPLAAEEGSPVSGELRLQFKQQKNSSLEKLDLDARGLALKREFVLVAITGTGTNAVASVPSDKRGRLSLSWSRKGQGGDNGKNAFPDELASVADLRAIALLDGSTTVAWAWVNTSPKYQYLVKRALTPANMNSDAVGAVRLKANAEELKFAVGAAGLVPGAPYHLTLNSTVVASLLADADGRVGFVGWPASAPNVLDLRAVAVLDGSSNVVLSTVLPK
jgi:hypothetical protein